MDTFSPETYFDPLYYALGGNPAKLQAFVDAVLAQHNELKIDGFDWNEDLLDDFTYEQVEKYVGISPMAPVVDPDSTAIPFGRKGDIIGTGNIPRMKTVEYLNEKKIRTLKKLIRRNDVTPKQIKDTAGASIGEILVGQVQNFTNALTYQRDQMVSARQIAYNPTNNPYGISLTLSARVPHDNVKTLTDAKKWWTDNTYASEGASSDPVQDMKDMVEVARQKGVELCHFEINKTYLDKILGHSAVVADLIARMSLTARNTITSLKPFSREEEIEALAALVGRPIVEKGHISSVEYLNGSALAERQFDSFEKDVVVLVPDGKLGEVLTVEPLLINGGNYAFAFGGKLAFTIAADYVKKCQSYGGELTSVCVPDKPRWMWYLRPNAS